MFNDKLIVTFLTLILKNNIKIYHITSDNLKYKLSNFSYIYSSVSFYCGHRSTPRQFLPARWSYCDILVLSMHIIKSLYTGVSKRVKKHQYSARVRYLSDIAGAELQDQFSIKTEVK
ncbi:hypothetical protein SS50377_25143 [Spironucleus salmonicida]|uniref:Uncharacterized protein n=1 Tax=Spironucleus salmonicida TaxID=348837 RepID=A0A9P8LRM9_9EUKA|nr:hypothetical protein SS50377_25143 [Spironucleus salmonicida]